jgi:hypothetical protein
VRSSIARAALVALGALLVAGCADSASSPLAPTARAVSESDEHVESPLMERPVRGVSAAEAPDIPFSVLPSPQGREPQLTRRPPSPSRVAGELAPSLSVTAASEYYLASNCNQNLINGVNSLVVRAPRIWSNTGTAQKVRYRSQLYKYTTVSGVSAWRAQATGDWHYGTAYPNTYWQDAARTWGLNAYGRGYYKVRIQTQYYSGGAYGNTQSVYITVYNYNYYYSDGYTTAWRYHGDDEWCKV